MSLSKYNEKRNFSKTTEPKGLPVKLGKFRFVVQEHHASRLHYDFRIELGGVLKSWAVPKGPSLNPADKRLAVQTEDHPVKYLNFEGTIPKGEYGAGNMSIWDSGTFAPVDAKHKIISERQALANLEKGELKMDLKGTKLNGEFVLVRLKDEDKNWLLIKHKDGFAMLDGNENEPPIIDSIRFGKGKKLTEYIRPMLASPGQMVFDDENWIFEIKWDGYRAIAEVREDGNRLYSRNGLDFSTRFPIIFNTLETINHPCILDGEIVLLNELNLPDFQKLQHYETNLKYPLVFNVFDMLAMDGKDMTKLPLIYRKEILKELLGKGDGVVKYCDHVEEDGIAFLAKSKAAKLEGIIGKNKLSTYKQGIRSNEWLKFKNVQTTEVVIVGYTAPQGSRKHFGALIAATKKESKWIFRGHIGTGFNEQKLKELKENFTSLETDKMPFEAKPNLNGKTTWLKPELVADIAYGEITKDGIFRHPVFMKLRDDKVMDEINEEIKPAPKNKIMEKQNEEMLIGKNKVQITNRQKMYFPDDNITKGDVVDYYHKIADYILPHLKNRPLSLKRNPNGILDAGFYHKDAGENAPGFVDVFKSYAESSEKKIDYILCNNKATLVYLANLGCIEMNPWNSTTLNEENPTWMVIDLDPSDKNSFEQVVEAALATKEVLDIGGVSSFCKTSGATGLHIYVPMKNKYPFEVVRNFGHLVARMVQEKLPKSTTLERSLSKRGPKIYVDYLQNRSGQTLASPYSLRPKKGATVSAPLEWGEVTDKLHPSQFNIHNIFERLEKKGDLFKMVLTGSTNIEKALKLYEVS